MKSPIHEASLYFTMVQGPSASIYQTPRCFVTYGTLGHVDPKQSSCSKRPWTTLGSLGFVQKVISIVLHKTNADRTQVDLIVSQDGADVLKEKLGSCRPPPYYRIKMSLGQILEREFFSAYIKTCRPQTFYTAQEDEQANSPRRRRFDDLTREEGSR